jgi:PhzF family phenazine biosynthesis protein
MHNLQLYQVDAFTDQLFGGNPAAVIPLSFFPAEELMQNIARENNLSETAFVVPLDKDEFHIRWFTPTKEVKLCGHATLATAHVLFSAAQEETKKITFQTNESGPLIVKKKGDNYYSMDFPSNAPRKVSAPKQLISALKLEPQAVLAGGDDLLVVLKNESQVRKIKPNMELLKMIRYRGVIVTAPGKKADCVSRCFYPRFGINEDPVTGSAHVVIAPYWAKKLKKNKLKALQLSERGGEIDCHVKSKRVILGGSAVTYMLGEVWLDAFSL